MTLEDIIQSNTEAVDVLSFEPASDFVSLAVPLFRPSIDALAQCLVSSADTTTSTTRSRNDHNNTNNSEIELDLDPVGSLTAHIPEIADHTSVRMHDTALHLKVVQPNSSRSNDTNANDNNDDDNPVINDTDLSLLHRELHEIRPSQLKIMSAILLYNAALTYHLAGIAMLKWQSKAFWTALELYDMAVNVINEYTWDRNRDDATNVHDDSNDRDLADYLLLAATTNQAHIYAGWVQHKRAQECFIQIRRVLERVTTPSSSKLTTIRNKYLVSDRSLWECLVSNSLVNLPGERFAPSA